MIIKPTLLLDEQKCRHNIKTMVLKAQKSGVAFRPHFKTHQSLEVGTWFKDEGVDKITVSSLSMADYFAADWDDITVAFPTNILEIETINHLARKIQLSILVESAETITFLKQHLEYETGFFIGIDVGYTRTGINPLDKSTIDQIFEVANSCDKLDFKGFLAHAGHTYKCRGRDEIVATHKESVALLTTLKATYLKKHPDIIVSSGDTPSCSVADDFKGIDEIRPGNFAFYDLTQHQIRSNNIDQISVALACPIVAIHKNRNEFVIYGGGVHFSKESLHDDESGTIFGRIVEKKGNGWGGIIPDMYVKSLSQEHGVVAVPDSELSRYAVGDYLIALPVHSCMTANSMKSYQTTNGKRITRL